DVRAVDAAGFRTEHQVVTRRAPGGLLQDLDFRHAVLLEEALLVGDEKRRGIRQRDEAELRGLRLERGALRACAHRRERADGARCAERGRALDHRTARELPGLGVLVVHRRTPRVQKKKRRPPWRPRELQARLGWTPLSVGTWMAPLPPGSMQTFMH